MASLVLSGDTTGTITVSAPAVSGSNTQTLVATTGTLAPIVSGTAVASTSGTSIDLSTTIPSWVKRITVVLSGVSTNGTGNWLVRIGSGSFQATGYTSTASYMTTTPSTASDTTGFIIRTDNASNNISGVMTLINITGNSWVESWAGGGNTNNQSYVGGGAVTLSGTLDRVRILTANGTDTFDAGTINILYE